MGLFARANHACRHGYRQLVDLGVYTVGVNQYIDILICIGICLSGDIQYIVLTIRQYNVGFENSSFDRRAHSNLKNGL